MTSLRRFNAEDLFNFANVNLDHLTETVLLIWLSYLMLFSTSLIVRDHVRE